MCIYIWRIHKSLMRKKVNILNKKLNRAVNIWFESET